ncbi:unnamed protein product, partial [Owenia fusiformis]
LTSPKNETSWVPICAHRWSYNNSRVLCRSIGYKDSTSVILSKLIRYRPGSVYVKANISCNGTEQHLKDCSHYTWEKATITYGDRNLFPCSQIVLSCDMRQLNVELRGTVPYSFWPAFDFYNEGRYGTTVLCKTCKLVCNSKWGITEAETICKLLGYLPQYTITRFTYFETVRPKDRYMYLYMEGFECKNMFDGGTHCKLVDTGCNTWKSKQPGVYCYNRTAVDPNLEFRLE